MGEGLSSGVSLSLTPTLCPPGELSDTGTDLAQQSYGSSRSPWKVVTDRLIMICRQLDLDVDVIEVLI